MKKIVLCLLGVALLIVFATIVTGCYRNDAMAYQQPVMAAPMVAAPMAPAVVVATPPAHDGFLTGMLMGHMMSGGGGYGYHAPVQHNTTIVQQSITRNNIVRPVVAMPRANTYVYRPSVRPSVSSRASYGSFRRR